MSAVVDDAEGAGMAKENGGFPYPESHLIGLQKNQKSGGFHFVMPGLGKKGVDTATSATLAAFYGILEAKEKLPKASMSIKFIGFVAGKHVAGMAIDIVVSQLFDTALADSLRTIGGVNLGAALEELEDANSEPKNSGKKRHRLLAQGHLGVVFQAAEKEAAFLKGKLLPHTDRRAEVHRKAALVAAAIALINQDAGMRAAVKWADKAKLHFDRYDALAGKTDRRVLERMNRKWDELQSGQSLLVIHPTRSVNVGPNWVLRRTAILDLEEDRYPVQQRLRVLGEERSRFEEFYQALTR
ncbi:hypothetical protein OOK31_35815 [Streptomyces sp. NBC_00249]|uniref:hypothetical protein n=1 Tax=Streptomyces sp. NBC_00249 TaxID=2975690 RepID=UPI002256857A|nr:hypothetical protein [Streptomyces sp. NBC_00249]MCX5199189.1 hypothetical protein [Streptomyces sp. NBC_00249]